MLRRLWMDVAHRFGRPHGSDGDRVVKQATINGYRILVFVNEEVGCSIYCYRSFERDESALIASVIREDAVCLDVGANVGYYSLLLASRAPKGQVHAFEPLPRNSHLLNASLLLNGFDNVVLNCCAVGNVDGRTSFTVSQDGAYSSFLDTERRARQSTITVPVTTLASYCRDRGLLRIDFLKLDVEGAEQMVLEGAAACFADAQLKPKIMMIELYEPMLRRYATSIEAIVAGLRDGGYFPFVCRRGNVIPFEREHHDRFWNVFFADDPARLASR